MPISYNEALEIIQANIKPLQTKESLPLLSTLGRICATDITASFDYPKYSMSLKEGVGVALKKDCQNYTILASGQQINDGFAVKLTTGQKIPQNINAVISNEELLSQNINEVEIPPHIKPFLHIKQEGEDIKKGELLLEKNEQITSQKITAVAADGISFIEVFKKPKVAIISIGEQLLNGEIHNSNAISIAARVIDLGGEVVEILICKESEDEIFKLLKKLANRADLIVTTGAMSSTDAMFSLLKNKKLTTLFNTLRISPARPSALSMLEQTAILHLPGLPLSCLMGFEFLGMPILRHLLYQKLFYKKTLINQNRFLCKAESTTAIPGKRDGEFFTNAFCYEAARLNILSKCNGYVLTENKTAIEAGEKVEFISF